MPKFFVTDRDIRDNNITIIGKDVNHIKNVLRKKVGDQLTICNTDISLDYLCKITKIDDEKVYCNII